MSVDWPNTLTELARPFPLQVIQWRAGATTQDKTRAQALPYVDPRVYERRLDEVCPGSWSVDFEPWGDRRIICRLTIHGLTRASTGESDGEGLAIGPTAEAQAFKRACSRFGLGRHLYAMPAPWVRYDPQRKRLLETPSVPEHQTRHTPAVHHQSTLSRERAAAMHRELGKLGVRNQYALASSILKRQVKSFTALNEAEAQRVWHQARLTHQSATRQVSDEEAQSILN